MIWYLVSSANENFIWIFEIKFLSEVSFHYWESKHMRWIIFPTLSFFSCLLSLSLTHILVNGARRVECFIRVKFLAYSFIFLLVCFLVLDDFFFFKQQCSRVLLGEKERLSFLKKMRNPKIEPLRKSELQKMVVKRCNALASSRKAATCSRCGYVNGLCLYFLSIL